MTWTLDLGITAAVAVVVWVILYLAFPSDPLGVGETVLIVAVVYGLVKLIRLAGSRLRRNGRFRK